MTDHRDQRGDSPHAETVPVHVMAGALFDSDGRVLIAQRPAGKHMAGGWEFPGGKLESGEDRFEGLKRELREELGIEVLRAKPLISYEHRYAERTVLLDLWIVEAYEGEPQALDAPALKWVSLADLDTVGLLEADRPMIGALRASNAANRRKHKSDSRKARQARKGREEG